MVVRDLFSKRQKRLKGDIPDVFLYDDIPNKLRVQIIHIIRDSIGQNIYSSCYAAYRVIHKELCDEFGRFELVAHVNSDDDAVFNYFLGCHVEEALDIIELCFQHINEFVRDSDVVAQIEQRITSDVAISKLNVRFKEHAIGYRFESNQLIRVDSTFVHSEVIKPALTILSDKMYKGGNEEFLRAHEHYRYGRNKECLTECLKAFESVMKAICKKRKWQYKESDTAKRLIEICFTNKLVPEYLQSEFNAMRSVLESGIPTIRNRLSGHGQGTEQITVEDFVAGYALNLTASNIVFLVNAEKV
jgi:hypothetical protein